MGGGAAVLPWVEALQVGMDSGWLPWWSCVGHYFAQYGFSNMQLALVHIPISYGFCALQIERTRSGGEQQLKRAQSGSSSWMLGGGKWGGRTAVEADAAIGPESSS